MLSPASDDDVAEAEEIIGYALPPLLRRIYLEVANGGVGPFIGIDGVRGGHASNGTGMLDMYQDYLSADLADDEPPAPPPGVVFLCDWGCANWSLLDCREPEGRMWSWEEGDRCPQDLTFTAWLELWINGALRSPTMMRELHLPSHEAWFMDAE